MANANIIVLNGDNFDTVVSSSEKLVIVDFWAEWCGPCRAVAPVLDRLAGEYPDRLIVGKLNVDEQQDLAFRFKITSIPTIQFYKGGKLCETIVGSQPYQSLKAVVDRYL